MINVNKQKDKTLLISWDPNDPKESIFNHWTEQDFISCIENYLEELENNE